MVGYMLRGFFEAYRRHIEWENRVVLPLASNKLDADALKKLAKVMIKNRSIVGQAQNEATSTSKTVADAPDVRTLLRGLCGKADPNH